jgi:hypothetical protein
VFLGLTAAPAKAQTNEERDKAIKQLQDDVSRLQKESTAVQIDRVKSQLDVIQQHVAGLQKDVAGLRQPSTAPAAAWWALMIVGVAFGIAWAVVGWRREYARVQEANSRATEKTGHDTATIGLLTESNRKLEEEVKNLRDHLSRLWSLRGAGGTPPRGTPAERAAAERAAAERAAAERDAAEVERRRVRNLSRGQDHEAR